MVFQTAILAKGSIPATQLPLQTIPTSTKNNILLGWPGQV